MRIFWITYTAGSGIVIVYASPSEPVASISLVKFERMLITYIVFHHQKSSSFQLFTLHATTQYYHHHIAPSLFLRLEILQFPIKFHIS